MELELRFRNLYWLTGHSRKLELRNKRLLYVILLTPLWSCGLPIWSYTASFNLNHLQIMQKVFVKSPMPRYTLPIQQLYQDLNVQCVTILAQRFAVRFKRKLHKLPNSLALQLLENRSM